MHELKKRNPDKTFYPAGPMQICPNMKKLTMEKLLHVLKEEDSEITLPEKLMREAKAPMEEMLRLAK